VSSTIERPRRPAANYVDTPGDRRANYLDLSGQRFGRLVAVAPTERRGRNRSKIWLAVCDCGEKTEASADNLRTGHTVSCGCYMRERASASNVIHGGSHRGRHTTEYKTWSSMRGRCADPQDKNYGGRGIAVCERWGSYENFLADMGPRPDGHSIERVDVNGNYEPSNCIWLPMAEQSKNRRRSKRGAG
jgi:hypothetical protein